MSQAEASASHWVLLFFLGLLNKYMLAWSTDAAASPVLRNFAYRTWSAWTPWSACSRTCGGGVKMRTRVCKMRVYGNRGVPNACVGDTVEYGLCAVHNCSPYEKEFLEYQCSLRDEQSVRGWQREEWIPYRHGKNPCELQCWSRVRMVAHSFGKAVDGTKCATEDPRQPAICVNGRCTPVDCAGQIGQDNRLDRCGVCRGSNSTCVLFQDEFQSRPRSKTSHKGSKDHHYEYEKIATIPAGATEVVVRENSETNFIALTDHKDRYQLNGNWRIQSPGQFSIHGSEMLYNRSWSGEESLSTLGPTRFDIHIYVLGTGDIPTVFYKYWISKNNSFKPVRSSQALNASKPVGVFENENGGSDYAQPENNHIHDASPTKKRNIPVTKFQGYKSYYHRNEILKSVPSWSVKRRRTHKIGGHFAPTTRNSADATAKLVPRQVQSGSRTGRRVPQGSRPYYVAPGNFTSATRPDGGATTAGTDKNAEAEHSKKSERHDLKQSSSLPRKSVFEQDEGGKPALTEPRFQEKENTLSTEFGNAEPKRKQKRNKNRRQSKNGKKDCLPCPKANRQKKSFCTNEFVLRAAILSTEKQNTDFRYEIEIKRSFKNKIPLSSREYLWNPCPCPKLRPGREYIIMGHTALRGDRRESHLLIDGQSYVRRYSPKRERTLTKLFRKQGTMCRKFE